MSDARAELLSNAVRHYPWGSRTVLPALLGEPAPAAEPWAEIWMGAHPMEPSHLPDGRSLAEVEPGLPFLVKLLAAEEPLSVQAHPDLEQARTGFVAEEARGVRLSAADRSYKDTNHKPELFVALGTTETLCGFRPPEAIAATADRLASARFSELVGSTSSGTDPGEQLRATFTRLLELAGADRTALLADVTAACARVAADPAEPDRTAAQWVLRLGERYPADTGALTPLLLELVVLAPGDGLFVGAGVLHAYLHGSGVEVQASSDNVLRGGLTGKHVDVAELLRVVRFEVAAGHRVVPRPLGPGLDVYDVGVPDFAVWRAHPSGSPVPLPVTGPCITVCVSDQVRVCGVLLGPGMAAYVPRDVAVVVDGTGTCFVTASGEQRSHEDGQTDHAG
jgi:mannose-6-phosphate isomerase